MFPEATSQGWTRRLCRSKRGFSLIELLIVAALVLIMFVMLHGSSAQSYQRRQKEACKRNLQSIYVALELYAGEHGGAFPVNGEAKSSEAALAVLVPQYTSSPKAFICPGSRDQPLREGESFEKRRISYAYYMGRRRTDAGEPLITDEQVDTLPKIKGRPLFSKDGKQRGNNHEKYGGNIMFADGRTETASAMAPHSLLHGPGVTLLNPKP
jgi:prepilin-type N-terminal cleavage/methylation domain-containing protein